MSGGLALFYNDIYDVKVLFSNNRIIDIETIVKGKQVFLSFIYGDPVPKFREQVWERLTRIGLTRFEPWFIIGDFNELTGNHEKCGGALRHASSFIPFNLMIQNCGMLEFPCLGDFFSWRGWRHSNLVRCRLDRALANEEWHALFSFSFVEYLARIGSDHKPIIATIEDKLTKGRRQFRFDKRWIGKDGLMEAITNGWGGSEGMSSTSFVDRIISCRHEVSVWRKRNAPYGRDNIEALKAEVEEIQLDSNRSQDDLVEANRKLTEAYKDEEIFWKQKSRNQFMREGDKNTKYFQALTKQRRAQNRIIGLHNSAGVWVTSDEEIEDVAVKYFEELFSSSSPSGFDEILSEVPRRVSDQMNEFLTTPATEEEVRKALFLMNPEKAPGPDGMTALFYQKSWSIIKSDLLNMVNDFLTRGSFDARLNLTNICLIPKPARPSKMVDFRPISLCNVGYKIISKVLCQRLKKVLPDLISETQSAFVSGRQISDNVLIAQEMFHGLRTNNKCKSNFMAIKTDMSKAFDRVEWSFMEILFRKLGFSETWIQWMMSCITSVQYRVLINGQPKGRITPKRGLRQGDPLSPYLFILCTEVLIANIEKAVREKSLTGLNIATASPSISHLLFADDSLFFCKAEPNECRKLLEILNLYEKVSGQQINFSKSSLQFGHKVDSLRRSELISILSITTIGGMGKYLGFPESLSGAKSQVFAYVQDRLQGRINGWSSKLLSQGGKEIMIKSVATATPTYVMSCFRLPKNLTTKLTSAISKFWWSKGGEKRGIYWVAWKKLCRSKSEGGLGFRAIDDFNTALLAKQLWRLIDYPDSLFARVFKGRYYRNSNPLENRRVYSPSYGWTSIISARSLVQKGLIKRIGSGCSVSVWNDPWIPDIYPRPPKSKGFNFHSSLMVNQLIDPISKTWNLNLLNLLIEPDDVQIILGIPVSKTFKSDSLGWHFTKTGRYTVKSGYWAAFNTSSQGDGHNPLGPSTHYLQAHVWRLKCPQKIKHFIWQILSGSLAVKSNLSHRGVRCDTICPRCGADEETINHVLFQCPPALQTWALSNIPSPVGLFPGNSVFTNLDYLFWRIPNHNKDVSFPWILWYIWKGRNDKVFKNLDRNPPDILKIAVAESLVWELAQTDESCSVNQPSVAPRETVIPTGPICYFDGSWKETDLAAGLGWYFHQEEPMTKLVGARNVARSLSPLHAELEALLWAMSSMTACCRQITFATDCAELLKMTSSPESWPAFSNYLDEFKSLKSSFLSFTLCLVPRSLNLKADNLARSVRILPSHVIYVNSTPPVWISKPF